MVHLEECTIVHAPIERCFDLARSIEVHLLGAKQTGERAVGGVTAGLIGEGQFVRWRAKHFGMWQHLTSKITGFDRPVYLQDTMLEGAFRFMQHDHFFTALPNGATEMRDRFVFAAPFPVIGRVAESLFLRRYMRKFLRERNEVLKRLAESNRWSDFLPGS